MRRAAIAVCLLMVPAAAAVPYLQHDVDISRAGSTTDPGPEFMDIAFVVDLPGGRSDNAPPLIYQGEIFVVTNPIDVTDTTTGPVVWRIDRDDPLSPQAWIDLPYAGPTHLSLAGSTDALFLASWDKVYAYDRHAGDLLWESTFDLPPGVPGSETRTLCRPGMHDSTAEELILACRAIYVVDTPDVSGPDIAGLGGTTVQNAPVEERIFVTNLDSGDGSVKWTWVKELTDEVANVALPTFDAHILNPNFGVEVRAAATPTHVMVAAIEPSHAPIPLATAGAPEMRPHSVIVLDRADGATVRTWFPPNSEYVPLVNTDSLTLDPNTGVQPGLLEAYGVATAPGLLLVAGNEALHVIDEAGTSQTWSARTHVEGDTTPFLGNEVAVHGNMAYVTNRQTMVAVDLRMHTVVWTSGLPSGEDWDGVDGMIVANGVLYAITFQGRAFGYDLRDGSVVWQDFVGAAGNTDTRHGVGEGLLVVAGDEGRVTAYGVIPVGLAPAASISDLYPAPGQVVEMDASGTGLGGLSAMATFTLDWGDGSIIDLGQDTTADHVYAQAGEYTLTLTVANDVGQRAERRFVVDVGGTPPPQLNFVQRAFEPENYDLTFGLLGLAIALAGGLFAVARARRRRTRISREIDGIERAAEVGSGNPAERTAALNERRAHVRGLLLDGRIDEAQLRILETRIDELARGGRIESMRGRFDFLPHGFVMQVQEMLADGRLSGWEYDQLETLLRADESLSREQKHRVRGLLKGWAEEDAG